MSYVFSHCSGSFKTTSGAEKVLLEVDAFFRKHTVSELSRKPLVDFLPDLQSRLFAALPKGDYRFSVRHVSNLSKIYLYSGLFSSVNWTASLGAGYIIFENMQPVTFAYLQEANKKKARCAA